MASSIDFQAQIASIMEVLANAAVAEICKVVDEGYAVVQLEMSQSHKENEFLRKKIKLMELQVARLRADRTRLQDTSVGRRFHGVRLHNWHAKDISTRNHTIAVVDPDNSTGQPTSTARDEAINKDGEPDLLIIKEENPEVIQCHVIEAADESNAVPEPDSQTVNSSMVDVSPALAPVDLQDQPSPSVEECKSSQNVGSMNQLSKEQISNKAPGSTKAGLPSEVQSCLEGANQHEMTSIMDILAPPVDASKDLSEPLGDRDVVEQFVGLDSVKSELEAECDYQGNPHTSFRHTSTHQSDLMPGCVVRDRYIATSTPSRSGNFKFETNRPSCSSSDMHNRSSCQLGGNSFLVGKRYGTTEERFSESPAVKSDPFLKDVQDAISHWQKGDMHQNSGVDYGHSSHEFELRHASFEERFALSNSTSRLATDRIPWMPFGRPDRNQQSAVPGPQREDGTVAAMHPTGLRSYSCSLCGMRFAHVSQLKVHQRVHSGDKLYECALCGKRFPQLCSLKRHQRVHTGEKPFRCAQCGKQFAHSSNLKVHQSVHTGERRFSCSQCGKTFSFLSNLIRHQTTHAGK